MTCLFFVLLSLLLFATSAWAELGVCFDASRPLGQQFYWGFKPPGQILQDPHCTVVTKQSGMTESQMALIESTVQRPLLAQPTQPATKYLHVVPDPPTPPPPGVGPAVLFDEAHMQTIDDYVTGQQNKQQSWYAETQTPGVCQYTVPQDITTKVAQMVTAIHTDIQAMTIAPADKQRLTAIMDRVAQGLEEVITCDAARVGGGK
jgi:hypothetical protein